MRSMTIFNYLLEATLFGSVLILLVVAVRALLRQRLGSRLIHWLWLAVGIRLLLPLSIPNPLMDALRPHLSADEGARPVADQFRRRIIDAGQAVAGAFGAQGGRSISAINRNIQTGQSGKWFLLIWLTVALLVGLWLFLRQRRFFDRIRKNRVTDLAEDDKPMYQSLCERYKVKPVPVFYTDRLTFACSVGIWRPFIALPLTVPKAHLPMLLSHQLCHLKAREPLWAVLRTLCCALHWFNPLVWMAAYLSYRDGELACDDRATARMHDMDRLGYANAIVTESDMDSVGASFTGSHIRQRVTEVIRCVKGSRVAVATGSLLAAVVLVVSFATGESEPLPTVDAIPEVAWTASALPIQTDMDAIAAARRVLESPFIAQDTAPYAFTARAISKGWHVQAQRADLSAPLTLRFAGDGSLRAYNGASLLEGAAFRDTTYTHRTLTRSVSAYLEAFAQCVLSQEDFRQGFALRDVRSNAIRVLVGEWERGVFTLQVEPQTRVISVEIKK